MFVELKDEAGWCRYQFARHLKLWPQQYPDTAVRINVNEVSTGEFIERFEKPALPVVLTGVVDTWPATERWTLQVRSHLMEGRFEAKSTIG